MALSSYGLDLVPFIRASDTLESISVKHERCKTKSHPIPVDGKEARSFYEEMVGLSGQGQCLHERSPEICVGKNNQKICTDPMDQPIQRKRRKISKNKSPSKKFESEKNESKRKPFSMRSHNNFLKCAQEGDVKGVELYLQEGVDINQGDIYGWTAIMCAAHEGHYDMVQILLENGADLAPTDYKGRTIKELTKNKKILKLFNNIESGKDFTEEEEKISEPCIDPFYCELCKEEFKETTMQAHETSTLHLFNRKHETKMNHFFIQGNNKGYQMMVKHGWNEKCGLGPEGSGHKFPVKTVLKRDRKGFGVTQHKAKVTHFLPNDINAVKTVQKKDRQMKASTVNKKTKKRQLSKEKKKEIAFRRDFYVD